VTEKLKESGGNCIMHNAVEDIALQQANSGTLHLLF
jgi:hypothetical protein